MAGRPSITSDYVSVISQAIEKAQNDPAQLRSLVYDIARSCLAKRLLTNYHELGNAGWYQHTLDLEEAINRVESLSQRANEALTDDPSVQLLDGPLNSPDQNALVVRDPLSDAMVNHVRQNNPPFALHRASTEIYPIDEQFPEIIQPSEIWAPAFGSGRRHDRINFPWGLQLATAAFIGVVIYAVLLAPLGYIQALNHSTAVQLAQGAAPSNPAKAQVGTKVSLREANSASAAQALGFFLPTAYGVYAVSGEKLFALDLLPIRFPIRGSVFLR